MSLFGAGRRQQRSRRAEICILGLSKAEKMKITIVMRRSMRNFNTPSPGNSSGNLNLNIGPFKLSPAQAKIVFKRPT